jgi:hypothetical protein
LEMLYKDSMLSHATIAQQVSKKQSADDVIK